MSTASAKAAPVEDDPLVDIQDTLAHYYNTKTRIPRNVLFGLIEATNKVRKMAPPAAERTALDAIQGKIEDRLQAISMPKGSSTEDTLRWVLSLFDTRESTGEKA